MANRERHTGAAPQQALRDDSGRASAAARRDDKLAGARSAGDGRPEAHTAVVGSDRAIGKLHELQNGNAAERDAVHDFYCAVCFGWLATAPARWVRTRCMNRKCSVYGRGQTISGRSRTGGELAKGDAMQ